MIVSADVPMGLALMNLQDLAPRDGLDAMEVRLSSSTVDGADCRILTENGLSISTFRPSWWFDQDPITGKSVIPNMLAV